MLVSNMVYHYRVPVYNHFNKRLQSIGYELVVLTERLQRDNPHPVEFSLIEEPFDFPKYKSAIERTAPAIVMLFLHIKDFVVWPLLAWLKLRRIKVIYWNHGINLETPNNFLKKSIYRIFHSTADAIVLYSRNEQKHIARKHWSKLFVANNTIDFNSIPDIKESKEDLRRRWNVTFDKIVLFVGRITRIKRLDDLIKAASSLDDGIGVVIVGGGLTDSQEKEIRQRSNVMYLGEIYDATEINGIFKMSDIFCIPGKNGLGINQAFYWGLPLVAEDVLHSPEIVYLQDGKSGFLVKQGSDADLAEKINLLLNSPDMYESFSHTARQTILETADIDLMCDGFVNAVHYLEQKQT